MRLTLRGAAAAASSTGSTAVTPGITTSSGSTSRAWHDGQSATSAAGRAAEHHGQMGTRSHSYAGVTGPASSAIAACYSRGPCSAPVAARRVVRAATSAGPPLRPHDLPIAAVAGAHSHSIVAGGLLLMS